MSAAALHRAVACMNAQDLDGYLELYADDVELHGFPPGVQSREGARAFYGQFLKAFPDVRLELFEIVSEGDLVAARYVISGTHSDEFFGVPASGREVRVDGQSIFRFAGEEVVTRWQSLDTFGLLTQMGALPTPA